MDSVVERCRNAHSERDALCRIGCRAYHTAKVVAHNLLAEEVCALHQYAIHLDRRKTIFFELLVILVVAVVAIAVGVVGSGRERPLVVEGVVDNELIVYLCVVVGMVVVEAYDLVANDDFALGVVATILRHLLGRNACVREIYLRHATKREELHACATIVVARLERVRREVARCTLDIAVRGEVRQSSVDSPMTSEQSRREGNLLLCGVERAIRERCTTRELRCRRCRGHIERCSEGSCTCGRGTHATLQLHRAERRYQIGCVVPIYRVGLGIVHRHAIEGYIYACRVCATHSERGRAYACTALRRDNYRR